jgi:hypothetical protein
MLLLTETCNNCLMPNFDSKVLGAFLAVFFLAFSAQTTQLNAQCDMGEIELNMVLNTDPWGYEVYWEIYPEGSTCGQNTLASGGNALQVGCNGAGQQDATGGNGYPSNSTIEVGPICLPEGETVVIQFIDDWGDGGLSFQIFEGDQYITTFNGSGSGNTWTYTPGALTFQPYTAPCNAVPLVIDGGPVTLSNVETNTYPGEPSPAGGNCQVAGFWCEGGISNTAWASFIAPESGSIEISTCFAATSFDTQIALYEVVDCGDFSTYALIASNDDIPGGCGPGNGFASRLYAGCLEAGSTYYVQIDGYFGQTGDFGIEVSTFSGNVVLTGNANSIPCAINKGEQGTGSIQPYFIGYGSNFGASWSGPDGFTSQSVNINDLNAGTYTLTATTDCGDTYVQDYTINMPQPIFMTFSVEQPSCPLSTDGGATVAITGGTATYTIEWEGDNGIIAAGATQNALPAGVYTILVTDANGCEAEQTLTLTSQNNIALDLGPNEIICVDDELLLFGPVGYDYIWQDGSTNQFYYLVGSEVGEGTYNIVLNVSNADGCEALDAITVVVESCVSVDEGEVANLPMIYPNPASEVVNITNLGNHQSVIRLFDMSGRAVFEDQSPNGQYTLLCGQFASGVYIVEIQSDSTKFTQRLVIQ